jgi:hypothetical protein
MAQVSRTHSEYTLLAILASDTPEPISSLMIGAGLTAFVGQAIVFCGLSRRRAKNGGA